jgi:NAD(P)-dependent dehydrogenase (short-subunit alcohol dehydrogenase family)
MKNLVITGAARGFGREIALLAVRNGYAVLASVRTFDDAAKSLQEAGVTCELMEMTDPASIDVFAEKALEWSGGNICALINNAGIAYPGPVELLSRDDLVSQFQINVFGHIQLTQRLLGALKADKGRVVMISSQSALLSAPLVGAYSASKRALEAFTEALVMEVGNSVGVCIVRPGPYATSIWERSVSIGQKRDYGNSAYRGVALALQELSTKGSMGKPEDLAQLVLRILRSRKMRFIYGAPFSAKVTMAIRRVLPARWFFALAGYVISKQIQKNIAMGIK